MDTNMGQEKLISVTHFINPQWFWYHKRDPPNEILYEITQLEQELLFLYKNSSASLHYCPEPNDMVAVYFLSWNKFIRARVDTTSNISGTTSTFIVWAVDYGFPFETSLEHIRQIPASFGKFIDHIQCGGLAFVMPGEKEFDFMEAKSKMCKQEHWSQRACECLEKLINDATSVTFIEEFQTDTSRFWGDLKIVNSKGYTFMASDYLVGIDMAVEEKLSFHDWALHLNSIKIPRWLTNNGTCKYKDNVRNCSLLDRMRNGAVSRCNDLLQQNVENWSARKERVGKGGEVFGDSVSLIHKLIFVESAVPCDLHKYEREYLMRSHAALTNSSDESSPKSASSFAVNTEGTQLNTACENTSLGLSSSVSSPSLAPDNAVSSHKQKLIEIRKELTLTKLDEQVSSGDTPQTTTSSCQQYPHVNKFPLGNFGRASRSVVNTTQTQRLIEFRQNMLAKKAEQKAAGSCKILREPNDTSEYEDNEKLSNMRENYSTIGNNSAGCDIPVERHQKTTNPKESITAVASCSYKEQSELLKENQAYSEKKNQVNTTLSSSYIESLKNSTNKKSPDPYDGVTMLPAGFDLTRLIRYKDEENHWHRKKTTLNDVVPHDFKDIEELRSNSSQNVKSSTSRNFLITNRSNSNKAETNNTNQRKSRNENFCHPRSHTNKYKKTENLTKNNEVPEINKKVVNTQVGGVHTSKTNKCEKNQHNLTDDGLICVNPNTKQFSPSSFPATRSSLKKYKHRQLKSPAQQITKIEQLLRLAQLQKKIGNSEILDLNASNLIRKSDSSIDNSKNKDYFTSQKAKNSPLIDNQSSLNLNANKNQDDVQGETTDFIKNQLKLENLAKQLDRELNIEKEKYSATKASTVITLPLAEEMQKNIFCGERDLQTKFIDHMVLSHSKGPQQPVGKLSDAFFLPEIHKTMISMHMTKIYRIQAYSWSHLLRGNSLFVVNPIKSGKTCCYLPPICNLVSYRIQNSAIPETYGPVAIIMVSSAKHVERVNHYCRQLVSNVKSEVSIVPVYGVRSSIDVKIKLLNSCGVLVVTPANLVRLLRENETENLIDWQRLHHFIIDDLDLILERFKQEFSSSIHSIFKMVKKAKQQTIPLQLVVTSRDWNSAMKSMIPFSNQPLLLIGDFLEAAVYGNAAFTIKLQSNEKKMASVLRFIDQRPVERERILIMCNCDDDLHEVVRALKTSGHPCIGYASYTGHESVELRIAIEEWKHKNFCSQILVSTDSALSDLKLQNVQTLIHYSISTSWTKFTTRFATLAREYENFVQNDFHKNNSNVKAIASTRSLILLDEENNVQLPRLIDFMKRHNQLKNVHRDILRVSQRILSEREKLRISSGTSLCPFLLEFGECDDTRCKYRHNLTFSDVITKNDDIPTSGDIRIQILKVFSPTYYTARILEHKSSSGWKILRRSNEVTLFGMKLNMHYMNNNNCIAYWPPKRNDVCIYRTSDSCQRALILEVPYIEHEHIVKQLRVTVKLIDLGTIITNCKSDTLLVCHKEFIAFPAQAIDIRLLGIIPFDNERTWESSTTKVVENWILKDIKPNQCVNVNINFALKNIIWVKNVIVMERLSTVGHYIYRVNLMRSLIEKNFGLKNTDAESPLLAIKKQIIKINLEQNEASIPDEVNEELDHSINHIKFSSNDCDKFLSCTGTKSIKPQASNSFANDECRELKTTMCNSEGENCDKFSSSNIEDVMNVPLPDDCSTNIKEESHIYHAKSSIKEEAIKKTAERWCILPPFILTEVLIGDEKENGNWRNIFMQCIDKYQMQKFEELNVIIIDHIKRVQKLDEKKTVYDSTWLQPQQNCIVKYCNNYCRAKICGIFGKDVGKEVYRFFLCDYACFVTANAMELFSDFVYETTCEIVEYTPYQAVHCKLAGITLEELVKRHLVVKDYLYAYAVQHRQEGFEEVPDLEIQSYYILLYECENENDFSSATMFNKTLIEHNMAVIDSSSEHFLELMPLKDLPSNKNYVQRKTCTENETNYPNGNGVVSFGEFLQILANVAEMDAKEALLDGLNAKSMEMQEEVKKIKALCQAPVEKHNRHNIEILEPTKTTKIRESGKSNAIENRSVPHLNNNTSLNNTATYFKDMPLLKTINKRPQTEWYQTDFLLYITILAPDITEYHLEVTPSSLYFKACVNQEKQELLLNFLGTVEPKKVSHEIRGLKVIVRLVKSLYMKWPRLLHESTKYRWLKYNYDSIDEVECLHPQRLLTCVPVSHFAESDSDYNDDKEKELFQTFTPITSSEDCQDPAAEVI